MSGALAFCCPVCRGPVTGDVEAYRCPGCSRVYPIRFGIPDFRVAPDPRLPLDEDLRRSQHLDSQASGLSFEALLRLYWEMSSDTPPMAVSGYLRFALDGEERGAAALTAIDRIVGGPWGGAIGLEVGCGTGGFLVAARDRFETLVGVDVALRWLIVARRRLEVAGRSVVLVCAGAERLPFSGEAFDGFVALHTLEHAARPDQVVAEASRTLRPGGLFYAVTPNRFSLGLEPCVRVFGVGFVPRALADRYVRFLAGRPYRHIRLLSLPELRRLLRRAGFRQIGITAPRLAPCEARAVSARGRALVAVYHAARRLAGLSVLVRLMGPLLEAIARK